MQKRNKSVTFKNNAPFINCITKINGKKIDNAEDLDVVMRMYNLLEHSKNYDKKTGSLWNYYRVQPSDPLSTNSRSFKYKNNITENTYNVDLKLLVMEAIQFQILIMMQIKLVKMKLKLLLQ